MFNWSVGFIFLFSLSVYEVFGATLCDSFLKTSGGYGRDIISSSLNATLSMELESIAIHNNSNARPELVVVDGMPMVHFPVSRYDGYAGGKEVPREYFRAQLVSSDGVVRAVSPLLSPAAYSSVYVRFGRTTNATVFISGDHSYVYFNQKLYRVTLEGELQEHPATRDSDWVESLRVLEHDGFVMARDKETQNWFAGRIDQNNFEWKPLHGMKTHRHDESRVEYDPRYLGVNQRGEMIFVEEVRLSPSDARLVKGDGLLPSPEGTASARDVHAITHSQIHRLVTWSSDFSRQIQVIELPKFKDIWNYSVELLKHDGIIRKILILEEPPEKFNIPPSSFPGRLAYGIVDPLTGQFDFYSDANRLNVYVRNISSTLDYIPETNLISFRRDSRVEFYRSSDLSLVQSTEIAIGAPLLNHMHWLKIDLSKMLGVSGNTDYVFESAEKAKYRFLSKSDQITTALDIIALENQSARLITKGKLPLDPTEHVFTEFYVIGVHQGAMFYRVRSTSTGEYFLGTVKID